MITRIEIATRPGLGDSRGHETARKIRSFLGIPVDRVRTREVYRIEADLTPDEQASILREFVDPVLQAGALDRLDGPEFDMAVAVGLKPGVTDPVGKSARVAIEDTLGRALGPDAAVYSSRLYLLDGVDREQAARIAEELLANPVIETIRVQTAAEWHAGQIDRSVPSIGAHDTPPVAMVDLSGSDEDLLRLSREGLLALSLEEMQAIRDRFRRDARQPGRTEAGLGEHPTDVELECLAQTWSEHCKHKIFNATVTYEEPGSAPVTIASLFKHYIRRTTEEIDRELRERGQPSWLVSVFHDNAGVVTFDDRMHLVYKVETHNSPSALDPYGGAMTGIVGVNRDPFGTGLGSDLLVNVWGYCFASPNHDGELPRGLLHPRRIRDGVHRGVIDGGNQSGVPYGRGWELFDARYLGKPLVFCGTVGALPVTIAGGPGEDKSARPGDRIVMTGGRIGADGIHGATFSSAALDESAPVQAVQIGDPITQKRMFDFLLEARELGLYNSITDNGAGGLSSSVGEMAQGPGGAWLDLSRAPLKYQGLSPWEILVSEAQERMTLAVAPDKLDRFLELARRREVEATDLGEFTSDGMFRVDHDGRCVARLPMEFLHEGDPDLDLTARWNPPAFPEPDPDAAPDPDTLLGDMLQRLNIGSGEAMARHYDHEVKGLTVIKPWIGVEADVTADATVFLAHHDSRRGFVLSEGVNPFYSDIDTEAMAMSVVDEAVRRQLCAGAGLSRIAILDNFCWPDPVRSAATPDGEYKMAQLVRACRGLHAAARAYRTPLISGKDSMKNDSTMGGVKISVPPTLLVSAIGQIDDVERALTLELQSPGDRVYVLGSTQDETGGSEYFRMLGERDGLKAEPGAPAPYVGNTVPRVDPDRVLPLYRALEAATREGLIRSATTPGRGGWAVAFARSVLAAGLGLELDLDRCDDLAALSPQVALFSESNGRFLVTVAPDAVSRFESAFAGLDCRWVGTVTAKARLQVRHAGRTVVDRDAPSLRSRYRASFAAELPSEPPVVATPHSPAGPASSPLDGLPEHERERLRGQVRVLILTGLGLNCEAETEAAFRRVGASPERVHLLEILEGRQAPKLSDYHALAFIGGFAFGDHMGAGFVFANKIRWRLYDQLIEFIDRGGMALGVCNGFQTMVRLGLLPGLDGDYRTPRATLAPNARLGYRDAWVRLAFDPESPCVWTRGIDRMDLPSRHGEGRFLTESPELFERLEAGGQVVARYVGPDGRPTEAWPHNPNGSPHGAAGICDPTGRLFGLMPHPDAYLYPFQHPRWPRHENRPALGRQGAGLTLFRNGVDAAAARLVGKL